MKNKKTIHNKEIYKEIQKRLDAEKHELIVPEASEDDLDRQKEMNKELDTTLDTQKQISNLQKEASDDDVARQEKMKDAVDATKDSIDAATDASEKSDVAERIAHKVKERLEEEDDRMKDSLGTLLSIGDIIRGENNVRYQIRYSPLRGEIALQPSVEVDGEEYYADGKEITNVEDKEKFVDIVTKSTRIKRNIDVENSKAFINEGNLSRDTRAYMLDKKLDFEGIKKLEKQMVEVSRVLKDLEKNGGDPLSSKAAKAGNALGEVTYIFRQMLRDIDNDRISKEFETGTYESKVNEQLEPKLGGTKRIINQIKRALKDKQPIYTLSSSAQDFYRKNKEMFNEQKTNNHSNPVTEAAKKKLVDRINNIALKEGISRKEATIRVVKALKESK